MASNDNQRMSTRLNRRDYGLFKDGYDKDSLPAHRIVDLPSSEPDDRSLAEVSSSEILPTESVSQILVEPSSSAFHPNKRHRPSPATSWMWVYFEVTEVDREWSNKKTKKRNVKDRDIRCGYIDKKTGLQCSWKTSDSLRQTSTSNMKRHLEKHAIFSPQSEFRPADKNEQPTILDYMCKKQKLLNQRLLEKNILRWIIQSKLAITTIKSPAFQQIFQDIPGISLSSLSLSTLRCRLVDEF
ncbi:hypothetical protein V1514DRAFT_28830 [Lipomyces japonicus]|uniref:uncharacterized protein n=1 Tax=Lipomyces japonicus TaxID=56871 RepID=UPI0034CDF930